MAALVLATATACDDDDDPGTQPQTPTITVAAGAPTVTIVQGQNGTATFTITRGGGFTGPVTLTLSGTNLPAGFTLPAAQSVTGGEGSFQFQIPATLAPGTYPITVTATGAGVQQQTSTFNLVVTAAQTPAITFALDSTNLRVNRGQTRTANITITRTGGFAGAVNLAVDTTTIPRGVRVTLGTPSIAAGATTATVTITADTTAALTTTAFPVRITASGTGITNQTQTLNLTIAQAPGVTFGFIGQNNAATVGVGQQNTFRFLVNRQGGFTGPVAFALDTAGLPRGISIGTTTFSGDTAIVTFRSDSATGTPGNFTVTLRGTGTGISAQTLQLPITIQPRGTFVLTGPATRPTVTAGQTLVIPVQITRQGGFTGPLNFTATGLPAGVTARIDSVRAGDQTATVRLTIPANVAPGQYTANITAVTPGLGVQGTVVSFTVNPPGPGFTLTQSSPLVTSVLAGATNEIALGLRRQGQFSDSLTFNFGTLPNGLQAQLVPGTGANAGQAVLRLTAPSTLASGQYPVTVFGTGVGGARDSTTLTINVVNNDASFGYIFEVPNTTVNVRQGDTTSTVVNVIRTNLLANYAAVAVQNVPQGLTIAPTLAETPGGPLTLRISAASTLAPGRYGFRLTGATTRGPITPVNMTVIVGGAGQGGNGGSGGTGGTPGAGQGGSGSGSTTVR